MEIKGYDRMIMTFTGRLRFDEGPDGFILQQSARTGDGKEVWIDVKTVPGHRLVIQGVEVKQDQVTCTTCNGTGRTDPPVRRGNERPADEDEAFGHQCQACVCFLCGRSTGEILNHNQLCDQCQEKVEQQVLFKNTVCPNRHGPVRHYFWRLSR